MVRTRMILIVEDDPIARRALQALVAAKGFTSRAVPSAEDALDALQAPDLPGKVLIDIDLPGMSGLDLLRTLQQQYPHLDCTLMSANPHDVSARDGRREVPFLPKPLDLQRLFTLLNTKPPHA